MMRRGLQKWLFGCVFLVCLDPVYAAEVRVAVASNFLNPLQEIVKSYQVRTGNTVRVSSGSSGKFFAQIRAGAPFHVLLSADQDIPLKLENEGLAIRGSRFTYGLGGLALWSRRPEAFTPSAQALSSADFRKIAVANPKLAPYGRAAVEVMSNLGVADRLKEKIVEGENISQTFQFVATGGAELGFVALSQVISFKIPRESYWIVSPNLYSPIRQDAILLNSGKGVDAAEVFLSYLKSDEVRAMILSYGYGT